MRKILVTGGCGYIGSHTIVDLVNNGFEVISADNLSRGYGEMNDRVAQLLGRPIQNFEVDLSDATATRTIFEAHPDIEGIIHFAAYKSVPESVQEPLMYYKNNIGSLINILECAQAYGVKNIVFSSSCSVYGNADTLPVTEAAPLKEAESPYAATKQMGEGICADFVKGNPGFKIVLLRYFNPVGAHESTLIGEMNQRPENIVPIVTQTAAGIRAEMTVFGDDYDTKDGSCVRDYIHVMDIAHAHTLAIEKSLADALPEPCSIFNLGTGEGVTVLELIHAFEKISGKKLNYIIGPRRPGDVIKVYADNTKARTQLGWDPKYNITAMMETAWNWQLMLAKENAK
ncbi:UDP-glucose 4-epimerase GalE [Taibaiella sp. KBW10]|uniref:UDP-glucose 4-epimerase GalE n=1 Tax=Taibaiella sp. KBW10 TaxID=2153357 RepID=UPI000F5A9078|nr:UDP-glucose 4-epimerase GalE [Taibaiella sp. KBW10]RQO31416.1 UDP-glucose 4-epimerase GalE [Taibaiella sp. KBW10]